MITKKRKTCKPVKTNAMRLLDAAGVCHRAVKYDYDESDLSAAKAATVLGVEVSMLFKTLVLRGETNGIFVCLVAGDDVIDLKKAAAVSGNKKAAMVPMKDLLALTGYIRGGCTPVGMKKPYPLFIESACLSKEHIFISAGMRGMQLKITVKDFLSFTGAIPVDIV